MSTDTSVCEVCGTSSFDYQDPDTWRYWCRKCDTWRWFKWPKTGERIEKKPAKPLRFPRR